MNRCNHCGKLFEEYDEAKFDRHLQYVHNIPMLDMVKLNAELVKQLELAKQHESAFKDITDLSDD